MDLSDSDTRFIFFLPDARVLDEAEIAAIPAEKKHAAETDKKEGIWLEIYCPDGSCVGDDGRITISAVGTEIKSPDDSRTDQLWSAVIGPPID